MIISRISLLCILLLSAAAANSLDIQPRIIGGNASSQSYSWMVSVQTQSEHSCGGVLINKDYVLTAAHCLQDLLPQDLKLIIGGNDRVNTIGAEVRDVDWLYAHTQFNSATYANDIGIIKLMRSSEKAPVQLVSTDEFESILQGSQLKVMGWGITIEGDLSTSPVMLEEVDLSFQQDAVCYNAYGDQGLAGYWNNAFCAGEVSGGQDSCLGDSGGPILVSIDKQLKLAGLVSWGSGCGQPELYGVYTEVTAYSDWISARFYGVTISGNTKIGFLGYNSVKQERLRLHNYSNSSIALQNYYFEASSPNAFQLDSDNWNLDNVPAETDCEFTVSATGNTVGEQEGRLWLEGAEVSASFNFNSKVLNQLDVPAANLPWPFYSGTKTPFNDPKTEHSEPWYGINLGDKGIALSSGSIGNSERSVLLSYLTGPESGQKKFLRFDAKVDSLEPDGLYAFINERGVDAASIGQENPHLIQDAGQYNQWATYQLPLIDDFNHLILMFRKNGAGYKGSDHALIMDFRICAEIDQLDESCTRSVTDYANPNNFLISQLSDPQQKCNSVSVHRLKIEPGFTEQQSSGGAVFYLLSILILFLRKIKV
jgi:secreted trypsin-like serine protease